MLPDSTDFLWVVPNFAIGDLLRFVVWVLVAVVLPGHAIRRMSGLRPVAGSERWAMTCVFGILATSLLYWFLAAVGLQACHPPLVVLSAAMAGLYVAFDLRKKFRRKKRNQTAWLARGVRDTSGLIGLLLVVILAVAHVYQVASLVEFDAKGARLHGALFSDKMTNMSPCAALIDGVPPATLRMSGYVFPSHYFPHLFVAASHRAVGVDYVDGFWLHAAALGIVIRSLAVLAFCRWFLRNGWFACVALLLFALTRFTAEAKPLDLSFALGLLGIIALDRHARAGRRRWAVLAVCLFAAMPLYEVFTAATMLGGLAVWAVAPASRPVAVRLPIALAACVGVFLAVQLQCLGAEIKSPPEPIVRNSYRDSYKHEWIDLLRESEGERPILATVYRWKRGKPATTTLADPDAAPIRPNVLQRAVGVTIYNLGFVVYFFMRFVNLAIFGAVGLFVALRSGGNRSRTGWAAIASICIVGFGVPCFLSWGHTAGERWYETPNIYRLTDCGYLLLLLVGVPVLFRAIAQRRRPRWWIPLGLAGWQLWVLVAAMATPTTAYHHVDFDRLKALSFLRNEVPRGDVVIHPWVHDLIRDARRPEEIAWVYKRHFTLGSNLAGCQMFHEGRADHLFINGAVTAEEVFERERLGEAFYSEPTPEVVRRVVDEANVNWVVCDEANPAPPRIRNDWKLAYTTGTIRVYHGGDR